MKTIDRFAGASLDRIAAFLDDPDPSDQGRVHQFRLAIKKIRFLVRLLEELDLDSGAVRRYKKELRPIFKSAGKVREFQLFAELVRPYFDMAPILTQALLDGASREITWSSILFEKELGNFDVDLTKDFEHSLKKAGHKNSPGDMSGKVRHALRTDMRKWPLSHESLRKADWHALRRDMKWVLAMVPLMREEDRFSRSLNDMLRHTTELAGEWHDLFQCREWTRSFRSKTIEADEKEEAFFIAMDQRTDAAGSLFEKDYAALILHEEFNRFLS